MRNLKKWNAKVSILKEDNVDLFINFTKLSYVIK